MKNKSLIGLLLLLSLYPSLSSAQDGANGAIGINIGGSGGGSGSIVGGSCTNQAITSISSVGVVVCTTLTEAYLSFSDITTLNATSSQHGLLKKLSGNAYDFFLGDGTYGQTINTGTITTDKPWDFIQTRNNAAVAFHGIQLHVTNTAALTSSCAFEVFVGGTKQLGFCDIGAGTYQFSANRVYVGSTTGGYSATYLASTTGGDYLKVEGRSDGGYAYRMMLTDATCVSGCGTSPTIRGNGSVGFVTLGSSPSATTVVLGFGLTQTQNAICSAYHQTSNVYLAWAATTSQITLTGTFAAGNVLSWHCIVPDF